MFLLATALASTLRLSPADRCAAADVVVVAEPTGSVGEPAADGTLHTRWDLAVERVLKGSPPATVLTPGGRFAGLVLTVSEAAPLETDHRYLLFLRARPDGLWVMGADGALPLPLDPEGTTAGLDALSLGPCAPR